MATKKLRFLATFFIAATLMFAPAIALGATSGTGYAYIYPDQFKPSQTMQMKYEIANNTGKTINVIQLRLPTNGFGVFYNGTASPAPSSFASSSPDGHLIAVYGDNTNKLGLLNGQVFKATLTVVVGCVQVNKGTVNQACATDPAAIETGAHTFLMFENPLKGSVGVHTPTGSSLLTKTNTPDPKPRPLDSPLDNAYSQGISGSGIDDPLAIKGLFPPGPIDGMILLPITLANQILAAAGGQVVKPSVTILGYNASLPNGSAVWDGLGFATTSLCTTLLSFLILLPWIKSLYGRLQRATSIETKASDTWGVL